MQHNEPSREIMVLFVLRKLILQMRMLSHSVGPDVWLLVGPFVFFHTSCVRTAKALARLCRCAGSIEPSLVAYMINTIISWAGSVTLYVNRGLNHVNSYNIQVLAFQKSWPTFRLIKPVDYGWNVVHIWLAFDFWHPFHCNKQYKKQRKQVQNKHFPIFY